MNVVQEIIETEEEEAMFLADNILREDVPQIAEPEDEEGGNFLEECGSALIQWALIQKVRQAALLAAFREKPNAEESLATLCTRARALISNPSYILSVQEWVLEKLGMQESTEIHPLIEDVQKDTLQACNKIIQSLLVTLPPDATTEEAL